MHWLGTKAHFFHFPKTDKSFNTPLMLLIGCLVKFGIASPSTIHLPVELSSPVYRTRENFTLLGLHCLNLTENIYSKFGKAIKRTNNVITGVRLL